MPDHQSYYSNGKLLVTGEYLVLHGASALALPVRYGQKLEIHPHDDATFKWESWCKGSCWFKCVFNPDSLEILETDDHTTAIFIRTLIGYALTMNVPRLSLKGIKGVAYLSFDKNWGMGSSSTLISNIAHWFDIDPYKLHFRVSKGSGFDIACARSDRPVIYRLAGYEPSVSAVNFHPSFSDKLYFVYSGKKQDSALSLEKFNPERRDLGDAISQVSNITHRLPGISDQDEFNRLIDEHENILSSLLGQEPVKLFAFSDFRGSVKSLGAWGGDFYLFSSTEGRYYICDYLSAKHLAPVFSFDELILQGI
jgi:mevalonate kinase